MHAEVPTPFAGSISVASAPSQVAGVFTLNATVRNSSETRWDASGSNPVRAAYHWFDQEWQVVVFDGLRTPLPGDGLPPETLTEIPLRIELPPKPGCYILQPTLVREGVAWFESQSGFSAPTLALEVVEPGRHHVGDDLSGFGSDLRRRIAMTVGCRDCDNIPKHEDAGAVIDWNGQAVQVMHDGTKVLAGGYHGAWMQEIIARLGGHHEPQEELIFHHLLAHLEPGALMVEAGAFWAYYSNWFLGAVPNSEAICIEPDENNLAIGRANVALNGRQAEFHHGCAGANHTEVVRFKRESDHQEVEVPCHNWQSIAELAGNSFVDLLHIDAQGAELPFLSSLPETNSERFLRFVIVSTHHSSISGSATTHRDCLLELIRRGAVVLAEHTIEESFSGDGLIVASFGTEDAWIPLPQLTRNAPENSQFGHAPAPQPVADSPTVGPCQIPKIEMAAEKPVLATTGFGEMWVMPSDTGIAASLLTRGAFEENAINEVTDFLMARYSFVPEQFVDIGANIGTHLIYAIRSGLFEAGLAFEAEPLNYELLVRNVRLNNIEANVRTFHFPISNRAGAVTFERAVDNFGDHRIRLGASRVARDLYDESTRQTLCLVSEMLDNLDAEHRLGMGPGSLLWIDTQGHEGHVLEGAKNLIDCGRIKFVVAEFWPYGLERASGTDKFFDFLRRCRAIYDLRQASWQNLEPLTQDQAAQKYDALLAEGVSHTDLLCIL